MTKNQRIQAIQRELSVATGRGAVERRRMNRALLRGFNAGLLVAEPHADDDTLEENLRHVLGLQPFPAHNSSGE